jgi:hypothetical protein
MKIKSIDFQKAIHQVAVQLKVVTPKNKEAINHKSIRGRISKTLLLLFQ